MGAPPWSWTAMEQATVELGHPSSGCSRPPSLELSQPSLLGSTRHRSRQPLPECTPPHSIPVFSSPMPRGSGLDGSMARSSSALDEMMELITGRDDHRRMNGGEVVVLSGSSKRMDQSLVSLPSLAKASLRVFSNSGKRPDQVITDVGSDRPIPAVAVTIPDGGGVADLCNR